MERSKTPPSPPADRIGQLTIRNLDIIDTRQKLGIYTGAGLLGNQSDSSIPCCRAARRRTSRRNKIFLALFEPGAFSKTVQITTMTSRSKRDFAKSKRRTLSDPA